MEISPHIVVQAKAGERQAQERLIKLAYGSIWGYTRKYFAGRQVNGASQSLAEEATQRTFIAVQEKLHTLKDPEAFRPWLYRIATNCCREEERKHRRRRVLPTAWLRQENLPEQTHVSSPEPGPHESLAQDELKTIVHLALEQIPENQRLVIILKEFEGLKFREIAETLSLSENTVKSRLYYGLKALSKQVEIKKAHKMLRS